MNKSTVVKEHDFIKPDIHEVDCLLEGINKDCINKYFHTIESRQIYDIKFTNTCDNEEVNLTITHRSMEFQTEFYGLNKKIEKCSRKWFYI